MIVADAWESLNAGGLLGWLACLGVLLWIFNEGRKALGKGSAVSPQPLIVALEKEFVGKPEFTKFEKYVHASHHDIKNEITGIKLAGEERDEILTTLEERSEHTAKTVDTIARRAEEIEKSKYRDGKDVHDRINDVLKAVSRLEGRVDASNQRGGNHHG